ncbi:MAG: hypothetical protein JSW08_03995 [archaeon]|nr:MAG: hypothetical protein JSW08_03995 [archaeon]
MKKEVKQAKPKRKIKAWLMVVIIIIILILSFYFIILNPAVSKPELEKPALLNEMVNGTLVQLDHTHLTYILTELGYYKIHKNPLNGEVPLLTIRMSDLNKEFNFTTNRGRVIHVPTSSALQDVILTSDQETMVGIYESEDVIQATKNKINEGKFAAAVLKETTDLTMKGYMTVYNSLS